jgi:hypothetical protein
MSNDESMTNDEIQGATALEAVTPWAQRFSCETNGFRFCDFPWIHNSLGTVSRLSRL